MGKYLSPTIAQVEESTLKCAVIWYPSDDGLFFQNAVRGALAELRYGYRWEGDKELTSLIAQKFIEADLKTDKYFFSADCELIDGLTDNGDSEMAIEVNVNQDCGCGCGGGGGVTVINETVQYPNPTSTVLPPKDNILPIDDGVTIPDGFSTYEEYRDYKCGVATQLVDDFTETIGNLQTLGGLVAVGAGYASVMLGTAATYNAVVVGLMAAGLSVTGGLIAITIALVGLIALGSAVFSHFDTIFDELVLNREDFICQVFNSSNETETRQVFYDVAGTAVTNLAVSDGIKDQLGNAVVGIIDALIPAELIVTLFKFVDQIGKPDFDCSSCPPVGGWSGVFTFELSDEGWLNIGARANWDAGLEALIMHPKSGNSPDPTRFAINLDDILSKVGAPIGNDYVITALSVELSDNLGDYFGSGKSFHFEITDQSDVMVSTVPATAVGVYSPAIPAHADLNDSTGGGTCLGIVGLSNGSGANADLIMDNITITIQSV